ncbi:hypothetical protein [Actinoplanes sp. L3-i22]|uniref:hypothetical protein n=1 Tax=Actinoplanes sp. L3-i22 TaxID=2836373 RepID=UPI001C749568|nr:hypothetical protein [Actinoplanes sp. L3-i22]BCY11284.1 hypothetical protein L3i22_063720 [Actinoplanes sp. L3-i22]
MNGEFDVHLTTPAVQRREAEATARRDGLRFRDIVLDRGRHPGQPMINFKINGPWAYVVEAVHDEQTRLRDTGLDVVRTKIAIGPEAGGVPVRDAEATGERYFEQHVKVRLDPGPVAALGALVTPHRARLSRSAGGTGHRFVTQRFHRAGRTTALARFMALRGELAAAGHEILEVQERYVVRDTAPALDAGWFADAGPVPPPAGPPAPA